MNILKRNKTSRSQKKVRPDFIMAGIDGVGKTTILDFIKHDQALSTTGINFETIIIDENMTTFSRVLGGRGLYRPLWHAYYEHAKALIFVIDSHDRDRIARVRWELHRMINEPELKHKPILILANKQDLSNAMTLDELRDKLALNKLDENIKWHLQATSAIQNKGLKEGFEWLANTFVTKNHTIPFTETFNDLKKIWNKVVAF